MIGAPNRADGDVDRYASGVSSAAALPRVLYAVGLDPSSKFGSLEEQTLLLAQAFEERGAVFVPMFEAPLAGESESRYAQAGVVVESLDLNHFRMQRLWRLLALVQQRQVDLIHWSFYDPINPYLLGLSLLRPRTRHVLTDHNSRWSLTPSQGRVRRSVRNALLRRYGTILGVSEFVVQCLRREGVSNAVHHSRHFVNTDRFRADPEARRRIRSEMGADAQFVVLVVARLIEEKGVGILLKGLTQLPESVVTWVVGDGPDLERLRRLRREFGLEKRVRFFGNQDQVQRFMQAADCLACPSVWEEAAGLVNIEGLACGLPVIATRSGGIPEIIDDGRVGFLCERDDAAGLVEAIRRLFEQPELRARLAAEARRVAVERYSAERGVQDALRFYSEWRESHER